MELHGLSPRVQSYIISLFDYVIKAVSLSFDCIKRIAIQRLRACTPLIAFLNSQESYWCCCYFQKTNKQTRICDQIATLPLILLDPNSTNRLHSKSKLHSTDIIIAGVLSCWELDDHLGTITIPQYFLIKQSNTHPVTVHQLYTFLNSREA